MKHDILISIIIPVKNGRETICECIGALKEQSIYNQCEIIAIDSGSTDGTLEILRKESVQVVTILPTEFSHGGTRNMGVRLAKGEFVFMTVQDAVILGSTTLEKMLQHFKDLDVVGVCGQQIVPRDKDKNPHEWFRPISKPHVEKVEFKRSGEYADLSPARKRYFCRWDNVISMYRKSTLLEVPFKEVIFGEDMIWAKDVLSFGKSIVYDTNCKTAHYHFHIPDFTYKRVQIVTLFIYRTFGLLIPVPYSFIDFIKVVYRNLKWGVNLKWIFHQWSYMSVTNRAIKSIQSAIANGSEQGIEDEIAKNVPQGSLEKN